MQVPPSQKNSTAAFSNASYSEQNRVRSSGASTRAIITRLLENLGPQREVQHYLQHYGHASEAVAVVRVQGELLDDGLQALVSSLAFLREVGLLPVVILGAGAQMKDALSIAGVDDPRARGERGVTLEILEVARRVYNQQSTRLVRALEELGVRARCIGSPLLCVEPEDPNADASKGRIVRVDLEHLQWPMEHGDIPVVIPLGETQAGRVLHLSADHVAHQLTLLLQPKKLIFLTQEGGVLDEKGKVLNAINLAEDRESLMKEGRLPKSSHQRVARLESLLSEMGPEATVSVTSPELLPRELFTHRGAGTLVRIGERIKRVASFDDVNQEQLRSLLENVFLQKLNAHYFEEKKPFRVYLAGESKATAILIKGILQGDKELAVPYLDKFAVTAEAQGAGVGGAMWRRVRRENPRMYWRARRNNPINDWYFKNADGAFRQGDWVVFWNGLIDFDEVKACVEHALSLPASLRAHGSGDDI